MCVYLAPPLVVVKYLHDRITNKKGACDDLTDGCDQIGVLFIVDVQNSIGRDFFLVFDGAGPVICIPLIASVREGILDLPCIGLVNSEDMSLRTQIHLIWWL